MINDFIGIPYSKLDCFALVREVSEKVFGVALPSVEDYASDPAEKISEQKTLTNWVELSHPEPGCVVELGQSPNYSKHVGIYIGPGVLHTCRKYGSIIQDEYQLLATGYTNIRFFKWKS